MLGSLLWMAIAGFAQGESPGDSPIEPATAPVEASTVDVVEPPPVGNLLLRNVTAIDATGRRQGVSVVIRGGIIEAIGEEPASSADLSVMDLDGLYVIPGLMDMHVHLSLNPSAAHRSDTPEETAALLDQHLRAYLACGVTTVLDTGISAANAHALSEKLGAGAVAPRVYMLAPFFSPEGGYVNIVLPEFPAVASTEDVASVFEAYAGVPSAGIKVTVEQGMVTKVWELYTPEARAAIVAGAQERNLKLFAHAISAKEQLIAMEMGVYAMVHPVQKPPPKKLSRALLESGTFVTSTLSVFDSNLIEFEQERLDDRLVQLVVPKVEIENARDPAIHEAYRRLSTAAILPNSPKWVTKQAIRMGRKPNLLLRFKKRGMQSVGEMHAAGIPIALGSDSGNWPIFPFEFHGTTTLRELELLGDAGLTPIEALTAATLTPAEMLEISDRVGRIAVGQQADLVVIAEDPLVDLSAIRSIQWTIFDGVAHTPEEWMQVPEGL